MSQKTKRIPGLLRSKCLTCMEAVLIETWNPEQGDHPETFCGITGQAVSLDVVIKKCSRYDSGAEAPQ